MKDLFLFAVFLFLWGILFEVVTFLPPFFGMPLLIVLFGVPIVLGANSFCFGDPFHFPWTKKR